MRGCLLPARKRTLAGDAVPHLRGELDEAATSRDDPALVNLAQPHGFAGRAIYQSTWCPVTFSTPTRPDLDFRSRRRWYLRRRKESGPDGCKWDGFLMVPEFGDEDRARLNRCRVDGTTALASGASAERYTAVPEGSRRGQH